MVDLATVASACVGAAVSSSLHFVIPFIKGQTRNGNGTKHSGLLSPEDWMGRMRGMHDEANEKLMEDIRALMNARTLTLVEKVTDPIVREIRGLRDDMNRRANP